MCIQSILGQKKKAGFGEGTNIDDVLVKIKKNVSWGSDKKTPKSNYPEHFCVSSSSNLLKTQNVHISSPEQVFDVYMTYRSYNSNIYKSKEIDALVIKFF